MWGARSGPNVGVWETHKAVEKQFLLNRMLEEMLNTDLEQTKQTIKAAFIIEE